jgi:hypothetical protein
MSASGKRCAARRLLEFDHMDEVARGGVATVSGVRLRCRAHNQYEAERTFGAGFMENRRRVAAEARAASAKREAAQSSAAAEAHAEVRAKAETAVRAQAAAAEVQAMAEARAKALEVIPWLRRLGIRADEARQAATHCETTPDAPLEERVRVALRSLGRPPRPPEPQRASLAPGRRV